MLISLEVGSRRICTGGASQHLLIFCSGDLLGESKLLFDEWKHRGLRPSLASLNGGSRGAPETARNTSSSLTELA